MGLCLSEAYQYALYIVTLHSIQEAVAHMCDINCARQGTYVHLCLQVRVGVWWLSLGYPARFADLRLAPGTRGVGLWGCGAGRQAAWGPARARRSLQVHLVPSTLVMPAVMYAIIILSR